MIKNLRFDEKHNICCVHEALYGFGKVHPSSKKLSFFRENTQFQNVQAKRTMLAENSSGIFVIKILCWSCGCIQENLLPIPVLSWRYEACCKNLNNCSVS